jgi:predicted transcriptional regulator
MGHKVKHKEGLSRAVNVRFPPDLYDRMVSVAQELDRDVSWVIRKAVKVYLTNPQFEV